ncbi:MAG: hypothetical protein JSR44_15915 [Spirochaetes bacterium]|nr:hypothetical protein [Spirochaetota bacterium]
MNRFALALLSLLIAITFSCSSISTKNYAKNENRRDFTIDAAGGSYSISLFPKTYSALAGPAFSLVLVSPILFTDEILYNSNRESLIPWFNAHGISVWLVKIPQHMPLEKFGREVLPAAATAIRKNSTDADWVMGGVSLGGQAVAYYLADAAKNATVTGIQVKSAFFLGTPFDYNYPGSFGHRLAAAHDSGAKNLCAADFCERFFPGIKKDLIAARANLNDTAGKNVWSDNLATVSLQGKGVRIMFVAGKIDNVAPTEAVYKFFTRTIGDETKNSRDARFYVAGRMNSLSRDFDHAQMVASSALASDILPEILKWIEL